MYNSSTASTEADKVSMPSSSPSSCLGRAAVPVKRVWRGLTSRLGRSRRRRTTTYVPVNPHRSDDEEGVNGVLAGLGRLRREVRSCEYQDVHVMWEMLSSSNGGAEVFRGGSMDHVADDDDGDGVAAGKGAPAMKRTRARKPAAPLGRLVTYCCGAF